MFSFLTPEGLPALRLSEAQPEDLIRKKTGNPDDPARSSHAGVRGHLGRSVEKQSYGHWAL